ncbi:uncharacterized protein LOC127750853 [Frankliniella occidentalis]|uniref:Uncharacterized protein LOC127750853 n=1 Tax=Frankliniella occidentalis TaxID=133901 RepID=A0A9C6X5D2_FRAOC|nr:uncharacterized protein LOC127750853 [Frankliniella occidentalis]
MEEVVVLVPAAGRPRLTAHSLDSARASRLASLLVMLPVAASMAALDAEPFHRALMRAAGPPLGQSVTPGKRRVILGAWILTCFFVNIVFQAKLDVSFTTTRSSPPKEINSMSRLLASNLTIASKFDLHYAIADVVPPRLLHRVKFVRESETIHFVPEAAARRDAALVVFLSDAKVITTLYPERFHYFRLMETVRTSLYFSRGSPAGQAIVRVLGRWLAVGALTHQPQLTAPRNRRAPRPHAPLSMLQLALPFQTFVGGLVVALIVLVGEHLYSISHSRKCSVLQFYK